MKKINWNILNAALWTEVILSYLLPFQAVDDFQYRVGVPIPFITIYDSRTGISPLTSMHLDPIGFLMNGILIYWAIHLAVKLYQKIKQGRRQ